jgi:nicotinate phosphoribosyltransferase
VQLFEDERHAFEAVAETFNRYTLLLDTYDVPRAIQTAIEVAHQYRESHGHVLAAVRLDSGDLLEQSLYVRKALDEAGLQECRILGSGDLDEYSIAELIAQGAPFDAFGVGTSIGVGAGSLEHDVEGGSLGGVYKNVAYVDETGTTVPKVKVAGDKTTLPGAKEVYRRGSFAEDIIQLAAEPAPTDGSERLLKPVMRAGRIVSGSLPPLSEIWELASRSLERLPEEYRRLTDPERYPVRYSDALLTLRDRALTDRDGLR